MNRARMLELVCLYLLLTVGCSGQPELVIDGSLDPADIAAIKNIVQHPPEAIDGQEAPDDLDKRILRMSVLDSGDVEVRTGEIRGPLDGGGHVIRVRQIEGQWKVVMYRWWVS